MQKIIKGKNLYLKLESESQGFICTKGWYYRIFLYNGEVVGRIELHPNELTDKQKEVIQGLLLGENFFEISVEEYKYKIQYSESDNLSYYIYIKNDNSIIVKKVKINDNYDSTNVNTYSLNFSQ